MKEYINIFISFCRGVDGLTGLGALWWRSASGLTPREVSLYKYFVILRGMNPMEE